MDNKAAFDRDVEKYLNHSLFPPEFELLRLFKTRWLETDVLDLGVGAGRTALTFANLARSYVGVDYAPRMIELCRARVPESDSVRFVVADATDLSQFAGRHFDLILFSFNGIDYVSHDQRLAVLGEVRKLLKPDGFFFFSSHNLLVFPFQFKLPRKRGVGLLRWAVRSCRGVRWHLRERAANKHIDPREAHRRGWEIITDGDHDFTVRTYYVLPSYQVKQLGEAGFDVVKVYDVEGKPVDWRTPPTDHFSLSYLCRLACRKEGGLQETVQAPAASLAKG